MCKWQNYDRVVKFWLISFYFLLTYEAVQQSRGAILALITERFNF